MGKWKKRYSEPFEVMLHIIESLTFLNRRKMNDDIKLKSRLAEFFQEDNGGLSMTRLLTFLIVVIPLLGWLVISIYHWALTDYPGGVLSLQFGALGAKLVQKGQEQKSPSSP